MLVSTCIALKVLHKYFNSCEGLKEFVANSSGAQIVIMSLVGISSYVLNQCWLLEG